MKKYIVLFLLLMLCCSCKASYELIINDDLTVDESITGVESNEFFSQYEYYSTDEAISAILYPKEDYLNSNNFQINNILEDSLSGVTVSKKYDSLEQYFNKSVAYLQLYANWKYKDEKGIISLNITDKLPKNYDSLDRYLIDEGTISVTLPFKVLKENADKYNSKTNTYTWNINYDDEKEIYLQFDSNKMIKQQRKSMTVYIIIVFLIGIIVSVFFVLKKIKRNNKI